MKMNNFEFEIPANYSVRATKVQDYQIVADLYNLCAVEVVGTEEFSAASLKNDWEMPEYVLADNSRLVFSRNGSLAAAVEVLAFGEMPVRPFVFVRVHPDHRNQGLGSLLTKWGEQQARKVFQKVPPEARVVMLCGTHHGLPAAEQFLKNYGMSLERQSFKMRIEMTDPPKAAVWPEGISLTTYKHPDMNQLKAIYLADAEAFNDHYGYVKEDPEKGFERFKHHFLEEADSFDPDLWFLAMDGDDIAGICLCRKFAREDRSMGWVSSLGVRSQWRKRGIARALLLHSFGSYYNRGILKVGLGVDAESLTGALKLYKSVGMEVENAFDQYQKELRPGVDLSRVTLDS